jgi:8-oxo-dGTP diphosphatase
MSMYPIPQCFYRVSTKALILDETGTKFAVILEDNGFWELPGGGLDWGELPEVGIEREIREEMGLSVTSVSPQSKYVLIVKNRKEQWSLNLVYEVTVENLNFTPSEECREIRFIAPEEIASMQVLNTVKELGLQFGKMR